VGKMTDFSVFHFPSYDAIDIAELAVAVEDAAATRVVFGVGVGWNRKEPRNHGIDPARRWELMRENVIAIRELWTQPAAEFHGDYVDFDLLRQEPKPLHKPHPPVLIGGNGQRALAAVLDYGDGWIPSFALSDVPLTTRVSELRERAAALGRPDPRVAVTSVPAGPKSIEDCAAAGIYGIVFRLPTEPREVVLEAVGRLSQLVATLG
jgi:alkanesulfonate monooxygenase SsuD/methylene tetrahydromethanopterin reductase-like flavin-dependent oxidoreductase (luciferase family)